MIELISRQQALNFAPGTRYAYSNSNYFLLAEVIRRATKKPIAVFANENIFHPLGMRHTRYFDDHSLVVADRVPAYTPAEDGKFRVDWSTSFDTVGAGGVMSNLEDLRRWDENFYASRIGGPAFLATMLTRGQLKNGTPIHMALGLIPHSYRGVQLVEFSGALFGYRTAFFRFPDKHLSVILLCNLGSIPMTALAYRVSEFYLEGILEPRPPSSRPADKPATSRLNPMAAEPHQIPPPDAAAVAVYAGTYQSRELDTTYRLTVEDGSLVLRTRWIEPIRLTAVAADHFAKDSLSLAFQHDATGHTQSLTVLASGVRIEFQKLN